MTILLWGLIRYEDAYEVNHPPTHLPIHSSTHPPTHPKAAGELKNMRATVRWGLDWLLKTHTDKNELYVQVGRWMSRWMGREVGKMGKVAAACKVTHPPTPLQISDEAAHCVWGAPESMNYLRPSYKVTCSNPGSQPGKNVSPSTRPPTYLLLLLLLTFTHPPTHLPVMNTASAFAAGAIAFRQSDPAYANTLLAHAKELFDFAIQCPGDWIKDGR